MDVKLPPFLAECIIMGGFDVGVAVDADAIEAVLVNQDDQDMRFVH